MPAAVHAREVQTLTATAGPTSSRLTTGRTCSLKALLRQEAQESQTHCCYRRVTDASFDASDHLPKRKDFSHSVAVSDIDIFVNNVADESIQAVSDVYYLTETAISSFGMTTSRTSAPPPKRTFNRQPLSVQLLPSLWALLKNAKE